MPKFLKFITDRERAALLASASEQEFAAGEVILKEGDMHHCIFLIRSGSVRVELDHPEFNIEIAKLGEGEIFGEMSFIEGQKVSANVIADEALTVMVISAEQVTRLADIDDRFYGRFYQSLAEILSHRLRDTTLRGFL